MHLIKCVWASPVRFLVEAVKIDFRSKGQRHGQSRGMAVAAAPERG